MIDRRQVEALLRLRARLTWRRLTAERGRWLAAGVVIAVMVPVVGAITVGTWFGYTHLPARWPFHLLGLVLGGLWLLWIVMPALIAGLSHDVTLGRLLPYPLRLRELGIGLLAGAILEYPTLVVVPLYGAVLAAFGRSTALPSIMLALLIAYAHMVVTSQIVQVVFGGVLQSRRFRDAAIILLSLLGFSCYFTGQVTRAVATRFEALWRSGDAGALLAWQPLDWLQWMPGAIGARIVEAAVVGMWPSVGVWLALAIAQLALLLWLWWLVMRRTATGGGYLFEFGHLGRPRRAGPARAAGPAARWAGVGLSADIAAVARKEWRAAWRVPQRRVNTLFAMLFPLLFFLFSAVSSRALLSGPVEFGAVVLPFYALYTVWALSTNQLGWEHRGLATLFLTPIPRRRIFYGKAVAIGAMGSVPVVAFGALLWLRTSDTRLLFYTLAALGVILVALGASAVVSAQLPYPVRLEFQQGRRNDGSVAGGCVTTLGNTLLLPVSGLLALPVVAPVLVPWLWPGAADVVPFLAVAAALYAPGVCLGLLRWAGQRTERREPEILAAARPLED